MSFIINPFVFDSGSSGTTEYNGVSAMYTLRRPGMTTLWTNAVLKLRRSSDNGTAFVFFDGSDQDDTITLSSNISTTSDTTPDATTLSTWVGANDAFVERWYGITDDDTIDTDKRAIQVSSISSQPQFISSGSIITKGGKPVIDFLSSNRYLDASTNSDLASGNTFTIFTVNHNDLSTSNGIIMENNVSAGAMGLYSDRRTNRTNLFISATGDNGLIQYISQQNNADQRLTTLLVDNLDLETWLNGTSQGTDTYSGTYTNNGIRIGGRFVTSYLQGGIQEIIIFPSDKSSDMSTIHSEINTYYSIY